MDYITTMVGNRDGGKREKNGGFTFFPNSVPNYVLFEIHSLELVNKLFTFKPQEMAREEMVKGLKGGRYYFYQQ